MFRWASLNESKQELYRGYDSFDDLDVGLGLRPETYATPDYAKKKTYKLILGGMANITYAGWDHDREPLILTMYHNVSYNTVLAYNLHYVPYRIRKNIINFILTTNTPRIKNQQPIVIDYYALKRSVKHSEKIVRHYKVVGVRPIENVPLVEWNDRIREKSKWENWYKEQYKKDKSNIRR